MFQGFKMAANINSSQAQDIVWCKYCQNFPAEFYCQNCGDELCSTCENSHKTHHTFAKHVTVSFLGKKTTGIPCKEHFDNFYNEGCKTCGIPICPECKVKSHYLHTSIDINDLCDLTERKIKTGLQRIEKRKENIDLYIQQTIEVDRSREEVKDNLRNRAIAMKSCIDDILTASIAKIEKSYDITQERLLRNELEKEQRELDKSVTTIEPILNEDPIDKMFFIKEHPDWNKVSKTTITSKLEIPKFESKPLDPNDLLHQFGSLSFVATAKVKLDEKLPQTPSQTFSRQLAFSESPRQSHASNRGTPYRERRIRPSTATFYSQENFRRSMIGILEIPILINEIESKVNLLYHIAYSDCSSSMFISGYGHQHAIYSYTNLPTSKSSKKRFSPNPTILSVGTEPQGLTTTMKNTIVYTDRRYGIVEIFRNCFDDKANHHEIKIGINARIIFPRHENSMFWGVYCAKDGTYLVCTEDPAVVQFCKKGSRAFTHNSKGRLLFAKPRYVCVNEINQNICVSDFEIGIIVLNHSGHFIFNYRGNQIRYGKHFTPRGIACDELGRILVADTDNDVVHLLESNGEFITYILSSISPISQPWGLCVDSQNRVWVAERNVSKGDVKPLAKVRSFQIYKS